MKTKRVKGAQHMNGYPTPYYFTKESLEKMTYAERVQFRKQYPEQYDAIMDAIQENRRSKSSLCWVESRKK